MIQQLFYVPENIDLDEIIRKNPISHLDGFHRDNLLYILHLLSEIPSNNKDLVNDEGYVPINAEILKQWIGKGYPAYLNYLQDTGVIEVDSQFIIGVKSRGYRFSKQYQQSLKSILVTKSSLLKRFAKGSISSDAKKSDIKTTPIGAAINDDHGLSAIGEIETESSYKSSISSKYKPIEKWYKSGGIKINYELAHAYNEGIFNRKISDKSKWDQSYSSKEIRFKHPFTQFAGTSVNIEKIRHGDFNPHFDENVYRYHSALTSCKREIRNAISYNGEELVSIDLSNSQPTLLTLLLDHEFWLNESKGGKLNSSDIPYLSITPIFSSNSHFTNFITLCKKAQNNRIVEGNDVYNYYEMVSSGRFYNKFRQLLLDKLNLHIESNEEVKPMLFTVLFTDNRFIGQKEAAPKRTFKNLLPTIYEITASIKKKGAKILPLLLQRIESFIMYHKVVPRIAEDNPDLPIITIHDSIVTVTSAVDYVESVMRDEFGRCLGFTPNFKHEYWQESKLLIHS